jgi:hypothetical protein
MRRVLLAAPVLGVAALATVLALKPAPMTAKDGKDEQAPKAEAPRLPIAQAVLFSSGVGFFQREGQVEGDARVDLSFPVQDINDLLKSMVLQDLNDGHIAAVSYESRDPIEKTLRSFAINFTKNPGFGEILNQARGENVEVTSQSTGAAQPGTLTGSIMGVEKQKQAVGKETVELELLNLWCREGMRSLKLTEVQRVRFLNPVMESEVRRALEVLSLSHDTQKKAVSLRFTGAGKRKVKVSYVVENPIWKTSYRLVLDKKEKPFLQGWAVVENPSDEDWSGVKMALVSGRPISFQMDLYQPLYVPRPVVVPELFASLQPPTYEGGMGGQGFGLGVAATAPPPAAPSAGFDKARAERGLAESLQQQARRAAKDGKDANALRELHGRLDLRGSVTSVATAANLGDFFQYVIERPVSLPRQKSAMLPIVSKDVEAKRVSIYSERTLAKHPLLGLEFNNTTGMHLMQGPITVFDGSTYAGDARILDLQKGEKRLLSYAIDLGTEVEPVAKRDPDRFTKVKIVKGILQTNTRVREIKTYNIKNRSEQDRLVLIEHPFRADFQLVGKVKPKENASDVYRFEVKVPAGKTGSQEVVEERDIFSQTIISNLDDNTIRLVFASNVTDPKVVTAIKKSQDLKWKIGETQRELGLAQQKLADLERDQTRIRANLKETPEGAAAYKKYLAKLDAQEGDIDKLNAKIKELREAESTQKKEYENYLANLTIE